MKPTLKQIKRNVELETGLEIDTKTRKRPYVYARRIYMKLAKDLTNEPLDRIGNLIKNETTKDSHATVLHGINNFHTIELYEKELYKIYKKILWKLDKEKAIEYFYEDLIENTIQTSYHFNI